MSELKIPDGFGLIEGEVPYWHGRMSWKANWLLLLLGVLMILLSTIFYIVFYIVISRLSSIRMPMFELITWLFVFGLIFFIIAALRVYSSEYFMTNRRIYVKYGIISRRVMEIKAEWVTGTILVQGLIGRLLNYGNVIISTPGQYAGSVAMKGVSDPMNIRTMLEDVLSKNRERAKIEAKIEELEKEYEFGRISEERYRALKKKYGEELQKYL